MKKKLCTSVEPSGISYARGFGEGEMETQRKKRAGLRTRTKVRPICRPGHPILCRTCFRRDRPPGSSRCWFCWRRRPDPWLPCCSAMSSLWDGNDPRHRPPTRCNCETQEKGFSCRSFELGCKFLTDFIPIVRAQVASSVCIRWETLWYILELRFSSTTPCSSKSVYSFCQRPQQEAISGREMSSCSTRNWTLAKPWNVPKWSCQHAVALNVRYGKGEDTQMFAANKTGWLKGSLLDFARSNQLLLFSSNSLGYGDSIATVQRRGQHSVHFQVGGQFLSVRLYECRATSGACRKCVGIERVMPHPNGKYVKRKRTQSMRALQIHGVAGGFKGEKNQHFRRTKRLRRMQRQSNLRPKKVGKAVTPMRTNRIDVITLTMWARHVHW